MFVLANLVDAIATAVYMVLTFYMWLIIARAVISWVNADPRNAIVRFLYSATEPVLYRVRRALPLMGGIDFSPVAVIIVIVVLRQFLVASLSELAFALR
jgi:YggT family protein